MTAMLALLLAACKGTEEVEPVGTTPVEQMASEMEAVQGFVDTYNNETWTPLDITGDTSTGYQVNNLGTTGGGYSTNGFYSFQIDPDAVYNNEGWDGTYVSHSDSADEEYYVAASVLAEAGSVKVSVDAVQQVSNGESEKTNEFAFIETFDEAFPLGSFHYTVSTVDSGQAACYPASPVRVISGEAITRASWFEELMELTFQRGTEQNNPLSAPDNISWLPESTAIESESVSEVYGKNIPGPFFSEGQGNPYKGEFGVNAISIDYQPAAVMAALSPGFVSNNAVMCFRTYESDAILGGTYMMQAQVPVGTILDSLASAGSPENFDLILAQNLHDEKAVYTGYCKDSEPLEGSISVPQPAATSAWEANDHRLIDVSEELCGKGTDEVAFLSWAKLNIERN